MFNLNRRKTARFKGPKFIVPTLLILIIILVALIFKSDLLLIKSVGLGSEDLTCTSLAQIKQTLNITGQNILTVNNFQIQQKIKNKYACIKNIYLQKDFPNKLTIFIQGRKPLAILNKLEPNIASSSSQEAKLNFSIPEGSISGKFLVDETGFVYSNLVDNIVGTPLLYVGSQDVGLSKYIKSDFLQKAIAVLKKVKEISINVTTAKIEGNKLLIDATPKLVFSLKKDINLQLASLQLILEKAKMKSENSPSMELIDLRFDKPVVTFSPKK